METVTKRSKYDLTERTTKFGENILSFLIPIGETAVLRPLISQLVRSATSLGANYMEADTSETKQDFRYKISLCKKEAKETTYWIKMLQITLSDKKDTLETFHKEASELLLIFSVILKNSKIT